MSAPESVTVGVASAVSSASTCSQDHSTLSSQGPVALPASATSPPGSTRRSLPASATGTKLSEPGLLPVPSTVSLASLPNRPGGKLSISLLYSDNHSSAGRPSNRPGGRLSISLSPRYNCSSTGLLSKRPGGRDVKSLLSKLRISNRPKSSKRPAGNCARSLLTSNLRSPARPPNTPAGRVVRPLPLRKISSSVGRLRNSPAGSSANAPSRDKFRIFSRGRPSNSPTGRALSRPCSLRVSTSSDDSPANRPRGRRVRIAPF